MILSPLFGLTRNRKATRATDITRATSHPVECRRADRRNSAEPSEYWEYRPPCRRYVSCLAAKAIGLSIVTTGCRQGLIQDRLSMMLPGRLLPSKWLRARLASANSPPWLHSHSVLIRRTLEYIKRRIKDVCCFHMSIKHRRWLEHFSRTETQIRLTRTHRPF